MRFEMKIISTYQNNALGRQCSEAVWIKDTDPKTRINNKEEYHQPGDVEISYTKNDKFNNEKKEKSKLSQREKQTVTVDLETNESTPEDHQQKKITEFFIQNIRREIESLEAQQEDLAVPNRQEIEETEPISKQNMIEDARERRSLKLRGVSEM